jgi:hypothetical protein
VKIDAFCHIMPRPYYDRFFTLDETVHAANLRKRVANIPCLVDMDVRFAQMDEFGDYRQLINICAPPVEDLGSPEISRQMARIGNEADYPTEKRSRYEIWWTFGWEYDLSAFMARIVFSGVPERYPDLKLLIHHGGSMVPHFAGRVGPGWDQLGARTPPEQQEDIEGYPLSRRPIEYFRQMYGDTAMFGAAHALRCCIDFYGTHHILFGSDSPFDPERGPGYIRATIANLEEIGLSEAEKEAIICGNVMRLTGLTVKG